MSTVGYEIGATIPVQVGKGKMENGKDNTEEVIKDPKSRNEEFGYLAIQTEPTVIKETEKAGKEASEEGR